MNTACHALAIVTLVLVRTAPDGDAGPQAPPSYLQAILEGRGSPLVMLDGGTDDASERAMQAHVLAEDYRVIRLQTINAEQARRREPLPGGYAIRTESAALARTLDHLQIDSPVDLVGRSLGALVALDYALDHPHRIRTLTLLEPPVIWALLPPDRPASEELRTTYGLTGEVLSAVAEHRDDLDRLQRFQRPVLIMTRARTGSFQRRIDDLLATRLPIVDRVELPGGAGQAASAGETFTAELKAFLARHRFD